MKFENAQHLSMEQFEKICDLKFSQTAYGKSPIISDQRNEIKPAVICHVYTYMCAMRLPHVNQVMYLTKGPSLRGRNSDWTVGDKSYF